MFCSRCGKYISITDKCLTDSSDSIYCSVKCHWEGTHNVALSQEEKELMLVCLGNSLNDTEQDCMWDDVKVLYDRLRTEWHPAAETSESIIQTRKETECIGDFSTYLQSLLLDCGSCGKESNWQQFKDNNYRCPFCNWDSVRISQKEVSNVYQTHPNRC